MTKITDPEVLQFIADSQAAFPAEAIDADIQDCRAHYDSMCKIFWRPHPKGVRVTDVEVCGVPVRRYTPETCGERAILYSHGGGFVVGSLDSHDDICAELAARTGAEVWSSHYRLSPEHIYPAGLDDVETVWRELTKDGRDAIVVGDSAGARLSAAFCLRMRRLDGPVPLAQVLIYPALGSSTDLPSFIEHANAPLLSAAEMESYEALYRGDNTDDDDPELAPLQAQDFADLPPAFVVTADVDPLRDEGMVFVENLREHGVTARWRNEPQLIHGFLRARHSCKIARDSFSEIVNAAKTFLA